MPDYKDDQAQTRLALAALTACIAQTLGEQDATFVPRLRENLKKACYLLRDSGSDILGTLETIRNVEQLLKP
ncbi:MAG: hypothetical protein L0H15_07805 [Nitrosospira sp.]|nr:hypothetical protein [Nitrosospira sp.]